MYELENAKDQIMTVCKVAMANLVDVKNRIGANICNCMVYKPSRYCATALPRFSFLSLSDGRAKTKRAAGAGIVALVVVSLLTPAEPVESLGPFFDRLQTSSDDAPATHRPLLLVNVLQLRRAAAGPVWPAFREDLGGLAIGCALVVALVAATAILLAR